MPFPAPHVYVHSKHALNADPSAHWLIFSHDQFSWFVLASTPTWISALNAFAPPKLPPRIVSVVSPSQCPSTLLVTDVMNGASQCMKGPLGPVVKPVTWSVAGLHADNPSQSHNVSCTGTSRPAASRCSESKRQRMIS